MNRYRTSSHERRQRGTHKRICKTKIQIFREVELRGAAVSFVPRYKKD